MSIEDRERVGAVDPEAGVAVDPEALGVEEPESLAADATGRPVLRRRRDRALVGGVGAGLADYLHVEPVVVRVFLVLVALASGIGFVVYPLAWALIPATAAGAISYGSRPWRARFSAWREALGIMLLVGAGVLVLRRAGLWLGDAVVLPLVLASCGVALILRQTGPPGWATSGPSPYAGLPARGILRDAGWKRWPGGVLGVLLVITAAALFLGDTGLLVHSRRALAGFVVIVLAVALVFGPWLSGLARSLASERSERIRSEERADLAAHLHDSVLQTLALIQRRADDPREVAGLARRQERELRHWLLARCDGPRAATLSAALEQAAADVEDLHKVRVEAIIVGDCPLDEPLLATVSAAREALTNSAKFAGEDKIDLYAEVDADRVQIFVRDRGVGFEPAAIPDDRRGVRHSILERMRQHGGRAEIRSEPGGGTEVELVMEPGRR